MFELKIHGILLCMSKTPVALVMRGSISSRSRVDNIKK